MNMHCMQLEGNFCDKQRKAVKSATIQDYNRHKGYVKKSHHKSKFFLLAGRLGNGGKRYSSISWTSPFSVVLSFLPLVVQDYHIDNSH
jgi:hypothetical protein